MWARIGCHVGMSVCGPSRHFAALRNLVAIEAYRTQADLWVHGLVLFAAHPAGFFSEAFVERAKIDHRSLMSAVADLFHLVAR